MMTVVGLRVSSKASELVEHPFRLQHRRVYERTHGTIALLVSNNMRKIKLKTNL